MLTKRGEREGQITMFIIIGFVLLFTFSFIYFITTVQNEESNKSNIEKLTSDVLQSKAPTSYTKQCVQDSLEQGLFLLGRQGGYIFKDQIGSKVLFDISSVQYEENRVAYIVQPLDRLPPYYPCYTDENAPQYCGFIYDSIFPGLSSYNYGRSRLQGLYQGLYSIKSQLEHYLEQTVPQCADFTSLQELPELKQYNLEEGNPKADVTFDSDSVNVKMKYPLKFTLQGIPPIIHLLEFRGSADIRFKDIYEAAQDMIIKDNNDLDYNLYEDTVSGFYKGKEIKFNQIKKWASLSRIPISADVNIIKITDSKSKIDTEPFVFQYAVQNRGPVLDYIPSEYPPKKQVEFAILEGDTLTIDPIARDPDDKPLKYSYEGWKANFNDLWSDITRSKTQQASTNIWENSADFAQTKSKSTIITTHSDAGFHNTTVKVSDLSIDDFQIVRILVELILKTDNILDNYYADVPNNKASIEDPYKLDARQTTWVVDPEAKYTFTWKDTIGDNMIFQSIGGFNQAIKCLILPSEQQCLGDSHNENINSMEMNELRYFQPKSNIIFNVTTDSVINQSYQKELGIEVFQCLPHKNPGNPIYPFNNPGTDPFQADHTCCGDDGKVRSGERLTLIEQGACRNYANEPVPPAQLVVEELYGNPPKLAPRSVPLRPTYPTGGDQNDIYLRLLTQKCKRRGNAVSGEAKDEFFLLQSCSNKKGTEDESCSGPASSPNTCRFIDIDNPQCVNYRGTTFEKKFFRDDNRYNGNCNDNWKCSTTTTYGKGGVYMAQGTCDGKGGCTSTARSSMYCALSCGAQCQQDSDCEPQTKQVWCADAGEYRTSIAVMRCASASGCSCRVRFWQDPC